MWDDGSLLLDKKSKAHMLTETRLEGKGVKHASGKFYNKKIGAKGREARKQKFLYAITPFEVLASNSIF